MVFGPVGVQIERVIVVKSQQTQQLTKDLVKTIAVHGFSALRKRHATPVFPADVDRSPAREALRALLKKRNRVAG